MEEDSNLILYGALFVVLGGVLVYGYRNFYIDGGFEDEDYEFDELEEIPELIQPSVEPEIPVVPEPSPTPAPPVAVEAVAPVIEPVSKPRKKWFGLFGKSESEPPAVIENLPPPTAEPVVAQPVAAEPVVAQPVVAQPVVVQPVEEEEDQ